MISSRKLNLHSRNATMSITRLVSCFMFTRNNSTILYIELGHFKMNLHSISFQNCIPIWCSYWQISRSSLLTFNAIESFLLFSWLENFHCFAIAKLIKFEERKLLLSLKNHPNCVKKSLWTFQMGNKVCRRKVILDICEWNTTKQIIYLLLPIEVKRVKFIRMECNKFSHNVMASLYCIYTNRRMASHTVAPLNRTIYSNRCRSLPF